ncbi:hypothetical protein PybrP1_002466, partial [[Pythium] brassicae (nom. inval.)]
LMRRLPHLHELPASDESAAAFGNTMQSQPFAASLGAWDPFPAPTAFGFSTFGGVGTSAADQPPLLPFAQHQHQPFMRPSFSDVMRLRDPRFPDRPSRASSFAAGLALGIFRPLPVAPGPPQQIDLTLSSSSSDSDSDDDSDPGSHRVMSSAGEGSSREFGDDDDDDGEVEILQTRPPPPAQALDAGGPAAAAAAAAARYLTYASVPPLQRKRRRRDESVDDRSGGGGADAVDREAFNGKRAESTTVSMENNEVIERFKKALKCSICLDVIQEMTSTICGHVYCGKCIRLAIRVTAKCPLCQRRLRPKDTHPLYF